MLIVYALVLLLAQLPPIQRWLGGRVAAVLSETLDTKVSIDKVEVGFFNHVNMNDILIEDQSGKALLQAAQVAGKVQVVPLLKGKVRMSSVQLVKPDITLYKKNEQSKPNYQFVIDALSPKEKGEKPTDIQIASLTVTDGKVSYDILDKRRKQGGMDVNHLQLQHVNAHVAVNAITDKNVDVEIKHLSFGERCGLTVSDINTRLRHRGNLLTLAPVNIQLKKSFLQADTLVIDSRDNDTPLRVNRLNATLLPSEIRSMMREPLPFTAPMHISTTLQAGENSVRISQLHVNSEDHTFVLNARGNIDRTNQSLQTAVIVEKLHADAQRMKEIVQTLKQVHVNIPSSMLQIGSVDASGQFATKGKEWWGSGEMQCAWGNVSGKIRHQAQLFTGDVHMQQLQLSKFFSSDDNLMLSGNMSFSTDKLSVSNTFPKQLTLKGNLSQLQYRHHRFQNIAFDGQLRNATYVGQVSISDPQGKVQLNGEINIDNDVPQGQFTANVQDLNSSLFMPVRKDNATRIAFKAQTVFSGQSLSNLTGNVSLHDVRIQSTEDTYDIDHIDIVSEKNGQERLLSVSSPIADATLRGNVDIASFGYTINNVLNKRLPALFQPSHARTSHTAPDKYDVSINVYSSQWLSQLAGIPLETDEPIHIIGHLDEETYSVDLKADIPKAIYKGTAYENTSVNMVTTNDTLRLHAMTHKLNDEGLPFDINITGEAYDSLLKTTLRFDNNKEQQHLKGSLTSTIQLFRDEQGQRVTHLSLLPSAININDEVWTVQPSDVVFAKGQVIVDHLAVRNGDQFMTAMGMANDDETSKIDINFKGLDVGMLSDILNVKDVTFDGRIQGSAQIFSLLKKPRAYAQVTIDDFHYTNTLLGRFTGRADWSSELNRLAIHGRCEEDNYLSSTLVEGTVQLKPLMLDLDIGVNNTATRFMETYLRDVIGRMDARATGGIHVFGTSRNINIDGNIVVNGDMQLKPLQTTYTLVNDTITFLPGHISFKNNQLADHRNQPFHMHGDVYHNCLKDWEYYFDISGDNFCILNRPSFDGGTACGTIYAATDVNIIGKKGSIDVNVECTPREGSMIQYNASSPESVHKREFIRWHDATPQPQTTDAQLQNTVPVQAEQSTGSAKPKSSSADLKMNMTLNTTPDLTLRVIMNEEQGDYIDLKGTGSLRASFFNKGAFNLFGNYFVSEGTYRMTIQNMLSRLFTFTDGGSIVFAGNPYDAQLNLQAVHTVNGVSLADLQIGNSFKSNNIRVNCLMNLRGTPLSPKVDFDLDIPTASADAAQMVRSVINSEEELNQQVIYLLTIGRFYNPENTTVAQGGNAQSQTSLAMQSLLSGTVSQQLNNILANVLQTNNNWSIGANISTGTEGWNNAEYEGLLSGRLLNNRLLINGQFGYRDNANATTSFIGDFDIRYLLFPNGNFAVRVYNQTNDRYFTRNSLTTQGIGLIIKKDFNTPRDLFKKKKNNVKWNVNNAGTDQKSNIKKQTEKE